MRTNPFGFALDRNSLTGFLGLLAPAWLLLIITGVVFHTVVSLKTSLPRIVRDVLEYGKVKQKPQKVIFDLCVPKRFFTHFYIWGTIWIWNVTLVYFLHCISSSIPSVKPLLILDNMINFVTGSYLENCSGLTRHHIDVAIVLSMLSIQVFRRLYECLFVSVFSSDARIHLLHYLLGLFFYPAVAFTVLLHLDATHEEEETMIQFSLLQWHTYVHYCVAVVVFLWASVHQHRCHKILAGLRQDKTDGSYRLPKGDWFELVSCPHFLAEVIIYMSPLLVLVVTDVWTIWWLVVVYIISTLSLSARQTHSWYKNKFEDYPRNRYAMIPWLI